MGLNKTWHLVIGAWWFINMFLATVSFGVLGLVGLKNMASPHYVDCIWGLLGFKKCFSALFVFEFWAWWN